MIVLCDPVLMWHEHHELDLMEFYADNKAKHGLVMHREVGRPLHKVLANAVGKAFDLGASHVLFTEHDHWGYPSDGLDRLLAHDKDVVGFVTHFRTGPKEMEKVVDQYVAYPFAPMCLRKMKPEVSLLAHRRNLRAFTPNGLETTDILTWAFTLVRTSVFRRMADAGFNPFEMWAKAPPDSYFCHYCEVLGIDRWVDSSTMIEHGDVPNAYIPYFQEMYRKLHFDRRKEKLAGNGHLVTPELEALVTELNL